MKKDVMFLEGDVNIPLKGTLSNLRVEGSQRAKIYTLSLNGADTSLSVTLTGEDTRGCDSEHRVSVGPGDRISICRQRFDPSGSIEEVLEEEEVRFFFTDDEAK